MQASCQANFSVHERKTATVLGKYEMGSFGIDHSQVILDFELIYESLAYTVEYR